MLRGLSRFHEELESRVALQSGPEFRRGRLALTSHWVWADQSLRGGQTLKQGSFLGPRHSGRTQLWALSIPWCQESGSECLGPEGDLKHPMGVGREQAFIRRWQARVC